MIKSADSRERFILSTIHLVAEEGLENLTTKKVALHAGYSEGGLFRIFNSKENLLFAAQNYAENELYTSFMKNLSALRESQLDFEAECRLLFDRFWEYLLKNPDISRFYISFYSSSFYLKCSGEYSEDFRNMIIGELSKRLLKHLDRQTVDMLITNLLLTMLFFVVRVIRGELPDNEKTADEAFGLVYHVLSEKMDGDKSDR